MTGDINTDHQEKWATPAQEQPLRVSETEYQLFLDAIDKAEAEYKAWPISTFFERLALRSLRRKLVKYQYVIQCGARF